MDVRTDVMMSIIFIELYNMNGIHYYENNEVPRVLKTKYQLEIIIEVRGL